MNLLILKNSYYIDLNCNYKHLLSLFLIIVFSGLNGFSQVSISADKFEYCAGDSVNLDIVVFQSGNQYVLNYMAFGGGEFIIDGLPKFISESESFSFQIPDSIGSSVQIDFQIIELSTTSIISSVSIIVFSPLQLQVDYFSMCDGCFEVFIYDLFGAPIEIVWSDGYLGDFRFYCEGDFISDTVTVTNLFCDQTEVVILDVSFPEQIQVDLDIPDEICRDGVDQGIEGDFSVSILSIIGGIPPYFISWSSDQPFFERPVNDLSELVFFEEEIQIRPTVFLTIFDQSGCFYDTTFQVEMVLDTFIQEGDFCRDGEFDPLNPTIEFVIPEYEKSIDTVLWNAPPNLIGFPGEDNLSFIVNEEESFLGGSQTFVNASIVFKDSCIVAADYQFSILGDDISFSFEVIDFEVDFLIDSEFNFESVQWDFGDGQVSEEIFPTHIYQDTGLYLVSLDFITECGIISIQDSVRITGPSSTTEIKDDILFFPNPTRDFIFINGDKILNPVEVYDIRGAKIKTEIPNENRIDLMGLKAGIYFLSINVENRYLVKEIFKY